LLENKRDLDIADIHFMLGNERKKQIKRTFIDLDLKNKLFQGKPPKRGN
jgi:hypothetical protein